MERNKNMIFIKHAKRKKIYNQKHQNTKFFKENNAKGSEEEEGEVGIVSNDTSYPICPYAL